MPIVPATPEAIREAARALARGDIVAFPTETVYGLGANALDASAVARIFAAKERPRFNPLIVHVPGLAEAEAYAVIDAAARTLAEAFWPGPVSLVLKKRAGCAIADLVTAGLDTIALRAPAHPVARALLAESRLPIAAPSANRSGHVSPTTAAHVAAELGEIPAMILDGGPCQLGIEFDRGQSSWDPCRFCSGSAPRRARTSSVCWGGLSPRQSLMQRSPRPDSSPPTMRRALRSTSMWNARKPVTPCSPSVLSLPDFAGRTINLSRRGDLGEAAANFFAALRELDAAGATAIAVMPIPNHGLGEAINDRLRRAACSVPPRRASDQP